MSLPEGQYSYPMDLPPIHQHKFVIPVEWASGYTGRMPDGDVVLTVAMRRVTKLRCECGEEIDRGSKQDLRKYESI